MSKLAFISEDPNGTIHDLSGLPVAMASMAMPFVAKLRFGRGVADSLPLRGHVEAVELAPDVAEDTTASWH